MHLDLTSLIFRCRYSWAKRRNEEPQESRYQNIVRNVLAVRACSRLLLRWVCTKFLSPVVRMLSDLLQVASTSMRLSVYNKVVVRLKTILIVSYKQYQTSTTNNCNKVLQLATRSYKQLVTKWNVKTWKASSGNTS